MCQTILSTVYMLTYLILTVNDEEYIIISIKIDADT